MRRRAGVKSAVKSIVEVVFRAALIASLDSVLEIREWYGAALFVG